MAVEKDILEILLSDKESSCLLWKDGVWQVLNEGPLGQDSHVRENGVFGLYDIVYDSDRELYGKFLSKLRDGSISASEKGFVPVNESVIKVNLRILESNSLYRYMQVCCYLGKDKDNRIDRILMIVSLLSVEECYRISLAKEITNDKHPSYFAEQVRSLFERMPDRKFAFIQFDVAKFKVINEQYGEKTGDELISFFIDSLALFCNENQLFTRLTADVFMICTPYDDIGDLIAAVNAINTRLLGYHDIPYRLVFGICLVDDKSENIRRYGDGAALARQSIKNDAMHFYAFFEDKMRNSARMGKFIEDHMEQALNDREFVMYLQPKYSISKEKIIGAEALVRWIDPKRGIISPGDFIPLFEKNGFVIKIDQFIWEEACKTIRQWIDAGVEPIPISVNMSRRHLKNSQFISVLNELTEKYQIPRKYLEIEITETVDEANKEQGVKLLKENGYTLLMDDFGSGYSSLNMLKDTQFDVIKIDRGFLQDFMGSERGQKIVEHTIHMTKAIGLDLVAEGVETREQAVFLSSCGCDVAQGFYYAKPMPLEDFNKKYSG